MAAESCGHKIKPETLKEGKYVIIEELGEHDYAMKPCSEHVHACALPNLITLSRFFVQVFLSSLLLLPTISLILSPFGLFCSIIVTIATQHW